MNKQDKWRPTWKTTAIGSIPFNIDNMTFSHHTASVNGIQLHYVIGSQGDSVVLRLNITGLTRSYLNARKMKTW